MKNKKKVLVCIMSTIIALCSSVCCATVNADTGDTITKGDWIYDTVTNEIIAFAGTGPEAVIPANSIVSEKVKFTTRGLYSESKKSDIAIKKFVVSENVTIMGDLNLAANSSLQDAEFYNTADLMPNVSLYFSGSEKLKVLRLPEGLSEIEDSMCYSCTSLEELYMPDSVEKIGKEAFVNCESLTELILPKKLKTVGEKAFNGCYNIKKLYIPANFDYTSIYIPYVVEEVEFEKPPIYTADFYRSFIRTKWFEDEVIPSIKDDFIMADGYLFKYLGTDRNVTIPNGTEVIYGGAFEQTLIENINIPDTVKNIEGAAFRGCKNLREVTIPKSVNYMSTGAFGECESLKKLVIDGSPVMEDNVFEYCTSLTDEGITINGEIKYTVSKTGEKSNPFAFTNTSYNQGVTAGDPIEIVTPKPQATDKPQVTEKPQATDKPQSTEMPEATEKPQTTNAPEEKPEILTVKGGDAVTIAVGDKVVEFPDAQPFVDENNRTQVPVRAVSEMLDAKVDWNGESKTASITRDNGDIVMLTLESDVMTLNGKQIKMDTAAIIKDDRTYIPVRFVAEALGLTVEWVK